MVSNVTPYTGELPDLQEPGTFDARMSLFAQFFETAIGEFATSVDELNVALNDNGSVLDALAEAAGRALNAANPVDTTGTGSAYALTLAAPMTSMPVGFAGVATFHIENDANATLDLGFGPFSLQARDGQSLAPVSAGMITAGETFSYVVRAGNVIEITSQFLREVVAGHLLSPLQSQNDNLDNHTEGGEKEVRGVWAGGPLGASADYDPFNAVLKVYERHSGGTPDFVIQTLLLDRNGRIETFRRVGRGVPLVWDVNWQNTTEGWIFAPPQAPTGGETAIDLTGIPSGVNEIAINLRGIDAGADRPLIQAITASGPVTTGYSGSSGVYFGNATSGWDLTDGFLVRVWGSGEPVNAYYRLLREPTPHKWKIGGTHGRDNSNGGDNGSIVGNIDLAEEITGLRIRPHLSSAFVAGGEIVIGWRF